MRFARIVLLLHAAAYLGFGLAFLLRPNELAALVDLRPDTAVSRTELRAFYGGLELGFGAWLLIAVPRGAAVLRARLGCATTVLTAVVLARSFGILVDGATATSLQLLAVEVMLVGLALAAWSRARSPAQSAPSTAS